MCKNCQLNPVYEFTNKRKLCRICFVRWFEKKFLTTIRKFKMIEKGDCIVYFKIDLLCFVVLEELLKLLEAKAPISIKGVKSMRNIKDKKTKIAVASTIDSTATQILHVLINENLNWLKNNTPKKGHYISPMYFLTDEEIELYAKLKKLKFKKEKDKKDKISIFIDELEQKHPEVKRAVVKGFLELR